MIYFVHSEKTGLIKIGQSKNVFKRIKALRQKDKSLCILGCVNGSVLREAQLHEWFFKFNVDGEWFEDSSEIRDYIAANKLEDRLVVSETDYIKTYEDWQGNREMSQAFLNRITAIANEKNMSFSKMVKHLLDRSLVAEEKESGVYRESSEDQK